MGFARYVGVQVATDGVDMGLFLAPFVLAGWGAVGANVAAKTTFALNSAERCFRFAKSP